MIYLPPQNSKPLGALPILPTYTALEYEESKFPWVWVGAGVIAAIGLGIFGYKFWKKSRVKN